MMDSYIRRSEVQTKHLTLANVLDMLADFGLRDQDVISCYAQSKVTNVEEYAENPPYRYNRCRFVELVEVLARAAALHHNSQEEPEELELLEQCERFVEAVLAKHKIFGEVADNSDADSNVSALFEY
jgi:hypothetical protein